MEYGAFMRFVPAVFALLLPFWDLARGAEDRPTADNPAAVVITLPQAVSRVLEVNPEVTASRLEVDAASARVTQAGVRPNPEIGAGAEDILAPGGLFSYAESTLQISQRLELGGKRRLRVAAAKGELGVARRLLDVTRAELVAETTRAFAEVLAQQERLANQRELSRLAREAHEIVVERVAAGKVSPVEQTRALVALVSAELEEQKQVTSLTAAKDRLAALWGGGETDVPRVEGSFEIPPVAPVSAVCVGNTPQIKAAEAALESRQAALAREQAQRKPDLTVTGGFRRLSMESQSAWVAGISIPLPIFDKREGAIAEARLLVDKAQSDRNAVEWRLKSRLAEARHQHEAAQAEVRALTGAALPAAKQALDAVEEGYRFGKFDFLNVLDAQRTHAELQRRYIEAVATGMNAVIEMQRVAPCETAGGASDGREGQHEQ
jgi:outer membrane protein, heavy metal efflux system